MCEFCCSYGLLFLLSFACSQGEKIVLSPARDGSKTFVGLAFKLEVKSSVSSLIKTSPSPFLLTCFTLHHHLIEYTCCGGPV